MKKAEAEINLVQLKAPMGKINSRVATDIKHGLPLVKTGRGGRADYSRLFLAGGSSYAAGSRPVVPFRDAWVQIGRPPKTCHENPNPGAYLLDKYHLVVL